MNRVILILFIMIICFYLYAEGKGEKKEAFIIIVNIENREIEIEGTYFVIMRREAWGVFSYCIKCWYNIEEVFQGCSDTYIYAYRKDKKRGEE